MDILETIARRMSIRTYEPGPASMEELEAVRLAGERAEALAQGEMRFLLRSHEQMGREVRGVIGNYGKTIRAPHYIVLASKEGEGYLTDAGFRFEQMVLDATRKGLGTCWVGLMFKEASLRSNLGLDDSWRVMVLTPIGRAGDQSFVSRSLRAMAGSSTRKPLDELFFWQRHGMPLPAKILTDERMARVLEAARRAPSWMNRQPWRFILTGQEILVYKKKHQEREGKDYHLLDCGIAMANLHLAAKAVGMNGRWELGKFEVPGQADAEPIGEIYIEGRKRLMSNYDLYKLLKDELGNGSKDLVTRPSGQAIRERIEKDIENEANGAVVILDFSKIMVVDYSCADEIIAKLVSRLLSNEYGDKYLLLVGLNENQKENIEVALERKGLAVMAEMRDGKRSVLGELNNYLKDTLDFIVKKKKATSKELSDAKKIEPNTSGTRLLNLYKKRLVRRVEETRSDGTVWSYELL